MQSLRHSAAQGHAVYFHVSSIQPVLISKRILVDQPKLHHTIKPDDAVTGTGNSQNIRTARMPSKQAKRALPSTVLSQKCPPGTALTECPPCSGGDPPDVPNTAPAHLLGDAIALHYYFHLSKQKSLYCPCSESRCEKQVKNR